LEQYGADALAQAANLYPDRFIGICSHLTPTRRAPPGRRDADGRLYGKKRTEKLPFEHSQNQGF
jgi:hypothetical protein